MFFKRLVDLINDKVNFETIPKTNEKYSSVTYGCISFIATYSFLSSSFDKLVNNLDNEDFVIWKKHLPDKWQCFYQKLAYPHENFKKIVDYNKPVVNLEEKTSSVN